MMTMLEEFCFSSRKERLLPSLLPLPLVLKPTRLIQRPICNYSRTPLCHCQVFFFLSGHHPQKGGRGEVGFYFWMHQLPHGQEKGGAEPGAITLLCVSVVKLSFLFKLEALSQSFKFMTYRAISHNPPRVNWSLLQSYADECNCFIFIFLL